MVKFIGLALSMIGVLLSGVVIARYGIVRALILGSILIMLSNLGFSWLATTSGPPSWAWVWPMDWTTWRWHCTARR